MKKVVFLIQFLVVLGSANSINEVENKEAASDTKNIPKVSA